jgi:hypothetical protein
MKHADNVFVHQKNIKLTGFSSRNIAEFNAIPYIDPKNFGNDENPNQLSNVYSVGVIMWQISSGHQPFKDKDYDANLMKFIHNGLREETINGTPVEYNKLYTGNK